MTLTPEEIDAIEAQCALFERWPQGWDQRETEELKALCSLAREGLRGGLLAKALEALEPFVVEGKWLASDRTGKQPNISTGDYSLACSTAGEIRAALAPDLQKLYDQGLLSPKD